MLLLRFSQLIRKEETMKRFTITASLVVVVLALSSVALASGTLAGKYATTIKSPAEFKGNWVLNLAKGGTYTVANNGQIFVRGKYAVTGSKITFGHESGQGACPKTGKYTWKKSGKTLKFTRLSDAPVCSGRSGVLARTFTQLR
jgi:hypothetical protein